MNRYSSQRALSATLLTTALCTAAFVRAGQKVEFHRAFAPSEGLTVPAERPQRDEICLDPAAASAVKSRQAYPALVLRRGWNHVVIKLFREDGKWEFGAELRCSDPAFLSTIEAALELPPS